MFRSHDIDENRDPVLGHHSYEGQHALHVGDTAGAITHFTALVDLCTQRGGPTHPRTLTWQAFLARALAADGDVDGALALQRQVISSRELVLGAEHPDTFAIRGQLARTLMHHGRPGEAVALFEVLLADRTRVLGADHAETLSTRGNLGEALLLARRCDESVAIYESLLVDRTRVLGEHDDATITTANNLAIARSRSGGPGVVDALVENLEVTIGRYGPDSTEAMTARGYLAEYHLDHGDGHSALVVLTPLIADRAEVLGHEHPATLRSVRMAAAAVDLIGDPARAAAELDGLITTLVVALGPNHIDTLQARLLRLCIAVDCDTVDTGELQRFALDAASVVEPTHELFDSLRFLGVQHPDDW